MKNYVFTVGKKDYNLRLTTLMTIRLEQKLGNNPLSIFIANGEERLPSVDEMTTVLFYCLQAEHKDEFKTVDSVYDLFDKYIDEGGNTVQFIETILEVFKISGLIPTEEEEPQKN